MFGFKNLVNVVAFKGSSYIEVLEKVLDFSDMWRYVCKGCPFDVILDCVSAVVWLFFVILLQTDQDVSWEIVA